MNKLQTCLLLLISLTWASCRKEEPIVPPVPQPEPVLAGIVGDSMETHLNLNPQPPTLVWDSLNRYGEGADSIDLDLDGQADLVHFLRVYNPDSIILITQGYPVPFSSLKGLGDWQVGFFIERIPLGMGAYMELAWTYKLALGDTIDLVVPEFQYQSNLWMTTPVPTSYGPWHSENSTKYAAIGRFDGATSRFGWVEINCPDREHISIARWAFRR